MYTKWQTFTQLIHYNAAKLSNHHVNSSENVFAHVCVSAYYQFPRADPGFEVRGGANGLENVKTGVGGGGWGWGGVSHIFQIYYDYYSIYIYIYIFQLRYISKFQILRFFYYNNTVYLKPLILCCSKKILFEIFLGGGALNPPLVSVFDTYGGQPMYFSHRVAGKDNK